MSEHNPNSTAPPLGGPKGDGREAPPRPEAAPSPGERLRGGPAHVVRIGGRTIPMPASRLVRIALGSALVVGGFLGFLPILGFWMIPLGLLILSIDLAPVRRWRRRTAVWFERRFPGAAARLRRWTSPSHLRGNGKRR